MKFSDYNYEPVNIETVKDDLNGHIELLSSASSFDAFLEAHKNFYTVYKHILSLKIIVEIRHTINSEDPFYTQEKDFWDLNDPFITQLKTKHDTAVLNSPFLAKLRTHYPAVYFDILEKGLKVFDDAIIEDLQLENALITQYYKLTASAQIDFNGEILNLSQLGKYTQDLDPQVRKAASEASWNFFKVNQDTIDSIFDQLVKVRSKMAHTLGYPSFVEMGYDRMMRLDYNQAMVEGYRKQVADTVVPVANKLYKRQASRIGVDALKYYDLNLQYLDGNPLPTGDFDQTLQSGKEMYEDLSKETHEFINVMIDNELLDLVAKKGKQGGGYMEFIPDLEVPFIFSNFNGTSGDVDVLTHEAGHAFQGYQSRHIELPELVMPTYEACEIHSMSMEFVTWPYMEKFFGDKADKYRFSHLASSLQFLPYGVQVDHFQHVVYTHPEWTPQERRDAWKHLDSIYRPHLDFDDNEFAASGIWWYRQSHIFSDPFYYIDYTLAQVCAFQFWKRFEVEKDKNAWNDYLNICKIGGTQSFLGIVDAANLISPFEDNCLQSVITDIDSWLETIDDRKL